MKNIKEANKYLGGKAPGLELVKGNGYFYFMAANRGTPESIYTTSIKDIHKSDLDDAAQKYMEGGD